MSLSNMSLEQLKMFVNVAGNITEEVLDFMASDKRAGVRQLYLRIMRRIALEQKETDRLRVLWLYEEDLSSKGFKMIAGVDEAGRGPLAGPVVAASVILPSGIRLNGLNDSKKLTPAVRDRLYEEIMEKAVSFSVGTVSEKDIDILNIYQASLKAMRKAITRMDPAPDFILVDAVQIPGVTIPQMPLVRGDGLSASIAAASVLAKVTRDRLMDKYDREYPQYGFAKHKGYGTREHMEAICKYGPCPIHRSSFNLGISSGTKASEFVSK